MSTQQKTDRIAKLVTRLATDPGITSLVLARSHTFVEIDHEIISTVILIPSTESLRKYVHRVLDNRLFKLAQE